LKYCYNIISSEENIIAPQIVGKVKTYNNSMRKRGGGWWFPIAKVEGRCLHHKAKPKAKNKA